MQVTTKSVTATIVTVLSFSIIVVVFYPLHSSCYALDQKPDDSAEEKPTPREQELLARINLLESALERQKEANNILSVTLEAKRELIAEQDKQIKRRMRELADVMDKNKELNSTLIEEKRQHRRVRDQLNRVSDKLRLCEAERDALARELKELRDED